MAELVAIFWRRRFVFSVLFVIVLLAAGAYFFLAERIYRSFAVVKVGYVIGNGRLEHVEPPKDVVARLRINYRVDEPNLQRREVAWVADISEGGTDRFIRIEAEAYNKADAVALAQQVADELVAQHQAEASVVQEATATYLAELEVLADALRNSSPGASTNRDPVVSAARGIERSTEQQTRQLALEQLFENRLYLARMQANPTHVETAAVSSPGPVRPLLTLVAALALLMGVVLGSLGVVVSEFWSKYGPTIRSQS